MRLPDRGASAAAGCCRGVDRQPCRTLLSAQHKQVLLSPCTGRGPVHALANLLKRHAWALQALHICRRSSSHQEQRAQRSACRVWCRVQGLQGPDATLACGSVPIHLFAVRHHEPQVRNFAVFPAHPSTTHGAAVCHLPGQNNKSSDGCCHALCCLWPSLAANPCSPTSGTSSCASAPAAWWWRPRSCARTAPKQATCSAARRRAPAAASSRACSASSAATWRPTLNPPHRGCGGCALNI